MPEENNGAVAAENVEAARATIAAAAITVETVQAAIETEAAAAEDRQEELLTEVRECRTRLEALSTSMERGAESPSLQQLLIQTGQMQTALETMQADLTALRESSRSNRESGAGQEGREGEGARRKAEADGQQSAVPQPANEPERTSANTGQSTPKSSQSATPAVKPAKRHYVKI